MKKFFMICTFILAVLVLPGQVKADGTFTVGSTGYIIDGQRQVMDVAPYIKDSRVFLPVSYGSYALGVKPGDIFWDNSSRTLTIIKDSTVLQMSVGSSILLKNDVGMNMDAVPEIVNGRVMLPLSMIARALGENIAWQADTQTVVVGADSNDQAAIPWLPGFTDSHRSFEITVPSLSYDNIHTENRDFEWTYGGRTFKWQVEVPGDLINWDREVNRYVTGYYNSNGYEQYIMNNDMSDAMMRLVLSQSDHPQYYRDWVEDDNNARWVGYAAQRLAACAQAEEYDYFHTAEFIQSFVGSAIPYKLTDCAEMPAQTLIDSGDCKDKSILLAALLKALGYRVALLDFPQGNPGHMAVGISFDDSQIPHDRDSDYYHYKGTNYYFAETTESNWLLGQASLDNPAIVIEING